MVLPNPSTMALGETTLTQELTLAGIHVDSRLLVSFAESFKRWDVTILTFLLPRGQSSENRKFNACVLPLSETAVRWVQRSSWFLPRQTVIYGIGGFKQLMRFVDLGVNALLETSSDLSVQAAVAATQPILSRGIGKCARVPIAIPVRLEAEGRSSAGITTNVGHGGMAVKLFRSVALADKLRLRFALPHAGSFSISASPRWYSGRLVGLRFDPSLHEGKIKGWVQEYSLLGCGGRDRVSN